MLKLPGLIDVHTHLRVPGGEHKEDFATGTAAALAGGFTLILAMPNTTPPLASLEVLQETRQKAQQAIRCDVGLFAGAGPGQLDQLPRLAPYAGALKIYLNETFGPLRVVELSALMTCFRTWPRSKIIAMHAEGQSVAVGIGLAAVYQRPVHFCHISRKAEIELIAAAKRQGLPVTCEVTPHHLFLTQAHSDLLGPLADMRPTLAHQTDVAALWAHLSATIDCIATDHAPHTLAEKHSSQPPPGVPGLETALPLMLTAVQEGRLTLERLIELMATNPRRIFNLPAQADTYVEVDPQAQYTISNQDLQTKCGWTPFAGMIATGRVQRVILRGETVFDVSQAARRRVLARPGSGWVWP
ncbi:MAG: amidohydrolase family protein [Anaerolineae bacterium]|nr:amidohydrolase family protein [Anaerolineae bacterium]